MAPGSVRLITCRGFVAWERKAKKREIGKGETTQHKSWLEGRWRRIHFSSASSLQVSDEDSLNWSRSQWSSWLMTVRNCWRVFSKWSDTLKTKPFDRKNDIVYCENDSVFQTTREPSQSSRNFLRREFMYPQTARALSQLKISHNLHFPCKQI
jgi:hypothetical protein